MSDFFSREAVRERPTDSGAASYVRSYLWLRAFTGILGILVPIVLVLVEPLLFDDRPFLLGSLSAYYYSGVREFFVGSLCAIGVFLLAYKIVDRSWENLVSITAAISVVCVALFPTSRPGNGVPLTPLQVWLGEDWVQRVHFTAAAVFLTSLGVISYFFARLGPKTGRLSPRFWRGFHLTCCGFIGGALALAVIHHLTDWPGKGLLIAEWAAIWAFAASWLGKGLEIVEVKVGLRPEGSLQSAAT